MSAAYRRIEAAAVEAERQRAWEAAQREAERREAAAIVAAAKWAERQRRAEVKAVRRQHRSQLAEACKARCTRFVPGAISAHVPLQVLLACAAVVVILVLVASVLGWM